MSYPRFQRSRDFKQFIRTAGDLTLNSNATWANLPTIGTTWDIVLAAQSGDTVECGFSGVIDSAAVTQFFDVATIVSAAAVNSIGSQVAVSNSNQGVMAWYCAISVLVAFGGSVMYPLVVGDISSSTVTLRLRYKGDAATNRNLHATAGYPLHFWAKNLGPADPN